MDTDNKQALKLLHSIALSNEMLITLSQSLRARPDVIQVLHSLEARNHQSGAALEGYVDAELANGKAICWWLDASWQGEHWAIETSILVNDDQGQHKLKDFKDRAPKTLDDFVVQLEEATFELTAAIDSIDLVSGHSPTGML
jgi:hypothetical protein